MFYRYSHCHVTTKLAQPAATGLEKAPRHVKQHVLGCWYVFYIYTIYLFFIQTYVLLFYRYSLLLLPQCSRSDDNRDSHQSHVIRSQHENDGKVSLNCLDRVCCFSRFQIENVITTIYLGSVLSV